jgi:DNA end-binding protein Ku
VRLGKSTVYFGALYPPSYHRGYEFAKDQYVRLTEAELESFETEASKSIDLKEFIPLSKIDPVYFESSQYLGPDEGGEKPYKLLADAMAKTGVRPWLSWLPVGKSSSCLLGLTEAAS